MKVAQRGAQSASTVIKLGCRVRIQRDETRWPSKGTWPRFRGRTGIVVEINRAGGGAVEYGVVFTKVRPRTDGRGKFSHSDGSPTWFRRHEIEPLGNNAPTNGDAA